MPSGVEKREEVLQYILNIQNDGLIVFHRANGCWQPYVDTGANVFADRVPQPRGCHGERVPAAPDCSGLRNTCEWRCNCGRGITKRWPSTIRVKKSKCHSTSP